MQLQIAVVMLETDRAIKVTVFDPVRKVHRVQWMPKSFLRSHCEHGQRDFLLDVSYSLGELEDWGWLLDLERQAFLEEYG